MKRNLNHGHDKKFRILKITDRTYKILCLADKANFDPANGLENLGQMFLALTNPENIHELELKHAKQIAQKLEMIS